MNLGTALLAALAYFICYGGNWLIGQCMLERPLMVGLITGAFLGDIKTGVIMGAALEAIYMGAINIGGATSAEPVAATVLSTTFAIKSGLDTNAAISLAIPVGLIGNYVNLGMYFLCNFFSPWYERLCNEGDGDGLVTMQIVAWFIMYFLRAVVIFIAVLLGSTVVEGLMAKVPAMVLSAFSVCAGILGSVGMAILMKMLWRGDLAIFFFVGFVLYKYLNLPAIVIAILAIGIAIPTAMRDKEILDLKNSGTLKASEKSEEEEFFG